MAIQLRNLSTLRLARTAFANRGLLSPFPLASFSRSPTRDIDPVLSTPIPSPARHY